MCMVNADNIMFIFFYFRQCRKVYIILKTSVNCCTTSQRKAVLLINSGLGDYSEKRISLTKNVCGGGGEWGGGVVGVLLSLADHCNFYNSLVNTKPSKSSELQEDYE